MRGSRDPIHIHVTNFQIQNFFVLFQAAHAEKIGNTAIGILPNMFTFPQNVDQLVDWVEGIASAAPSTPCLYYHIPSKTKVECKFFVYNAFKVVEF
jgi:dihydrodipicolinate synthase/N-acetylneuraminate lyase